jgi:hypothetical protein
MLTLNREFSNLQKQIGASRHIITRGGNSGSTFPVEASLAWADSFLKAEIMTVTAANSNDASKDPGGGQRGAIDVSAGIPAWLIARRVRAASEEESETAPIVTPPPTRHPPGTPTIGHTLATAATVAVESPSPLASRLKPWLSSQGAIGAGVSLVIHAFVLATLALFMVSRISPVESTTIRGVDGNSDDIGADLVLDSALPLDAGESAPLQMVDISQALEPTGTGMELSDSMRVGFGGKGQGEGESGDGTSMGVAALRIPGHAQTKGSFSAWADPRDPKPGQKYFVVIQIRLPPNLTKYRSSDISGNVIGSDRYRQVIRFKSTEQFPVENGTVEIRIAVPGAEKLVRDTIRVESKLLHEKQTFEIEF